MRTAPAVGHNGEIYIHHKGRLVGLAVEDDQPRVLWEYVSGNHAPGPVVVAPDGTLRLHTTDGFLHAMTASGRQLWSPALVGEPLGWGLPIVDTAGNTWISAYDGGLTRVDEEGRVASGKFFRTHSRFDCAGVLADGLLYLGSEDGYVFAIDTRGPRGENRWKHLEGNGFTGWFVNAGLAMAAGGSIVAAAGDEHVYGFAPDGKPLWNTKMPGQMLAAPVIDRHGHLYVGITRSQRGQPPTGLMVSLDGNSHRVRWEYPAAGAVESTPMLGSDGLLYFGDNAGVIHALDCRGQPQWTAKVETAVRSALTLIAPQRLACGLDNGTVVVLRCTADRLADGGWPKFAGTLGNSGVAPRSARVVEPEPAVEVPPPVAETPVPAADVAAIVEPAELEPPVDAAESADVYDENPADAAQAEEGQPDEGPLEEDPRTEEI